mmetsp:Transcript_1275/g.2640  ORF Transcript_1275/g.2640 Transcript_1275/m.2640 type:complete len:91 (-) Transcript_1275:427-699(-)
MSGQTRWTDITEKAAMELKKDINSLTYSDICPFADHKADVLAYKSTLHGAESKGSKKESGSGHELGVPLRSGIPERGVQRSPRRRRKSSS